MSPAPASVASTRPDSTHPMSPGRFFLDTDIFVYSFDASAPEKRAVA